MTPPSDTDVRELVERLLYWQGDGHPHGLLHGEAATALESLLQDRARMEERVRELEEGLARHNCGKRVPVKCICTECCDLVDSRAALSRSG